MKEDPSLQLIFSSQHAGDARSKFTKKNLIKYDKIDSQVADLNGARQDT
jgi:hypothetical protein